MKDEQSTQQPPVSSEEVVNEPDTSDKAETPPTYRVSRGHTMGAGLQCFHSAQPENIMGVSAKYTNAASVPARRISKGGMGTALRCFTTAQEVNSGRG